jgi:sulfur-oxidizing protein SoxX
MDRQSGSAFGSPLPLRERGGGEGYEPSALTLTPALSPRGRGGNNALRAVVAFLTLLVPPIVFADEGGIAEEAFRKSFSTATEEEWKSRLQQDEVNALCSKYRNSPPPEVAARILELSQASLKLPADTRAMLGDWKNGEKLASIGTGGHIGKIQPDRPDTKRGGNCYACHTIARKEVAAGNLGPALTDYAKVRGASPEAVQYVYAKIYNAQAFFPCSSMPRFGYNQWLTPQAIADITAFLLDPESPTNK